MANVYDNIEKYSFVTWMAEVICLIAQLLVILKIYISSYKLYV